MNHMSRLDFGEKLLDLAWICQITVFCPCREVKCNLRYLHYKISRQTITVLPLSNLLPHLVRSIAIRRATYMLGLKLLDKHPNTVANHAIRPSD